jgi:histidinol dehydrogenase
MGGTLPPELPRPVMEAAPGGVAELAPRWSVAGCRRGAGFSGVEVTGESRRVAVVKVLSHRDPGYGAFARAMERRAMPGAEVRDLVAGIIGEVARHGDRALVDCARRFDGVRLTAGRLLVGEDEFEAAAAVVTHATRRAIARSLRNITAFAKASLRKDWSRRNAEGAEVGERFVPFERVGVYVPGGKAPLVSTALMTAGFARAAGVPAIVAATPCGRDGTVVPELLYALREAGATEVVRIGGAQAIAALALGTRTIGAVDRIFGPGNRFVVEAKRQLVGAVSIDLLPGPSEILVVADQTGNPEFIAADLLAQAEHGGDSAIGLLTNSRPLLNAVAREIDRQLAELSRAKIIREVLDQGAFLVQVADLAEAVRLTNAFAPEHLLLVVRNEKRILPKIKTAGAVYLGNLSAVAVGDFLAGPSHTLPTGGAGRSFSGLRADQFQRRTSIVRLDAAAVRKSWPFVREFARIEGLDAHGRSVELRARPRR